MKRTIAFTVVLIAASSAARAQNASSDEPWRNVKFGATFEGYYEYNWNRPPNRVNVLRAYDTRANNLNFQQVGFVVDLAPNIEQGRRYGLRADLQYGQATATLQGNPANEPRTQIYQQVWQVFGTYVFPVGRGLQVDFGKLAANLGYETNYAKDNINFSRAYLFNFLPFYHSGARVTAPLSDKVTLMYMLVNGIQQTEDFNNFKSNQFTAIVKPIPSVTWTANFYFGQEQSDNGEPDGPNGWFRVLDTYVAVTPTPAWTLGADVSYTTNQVEEGDPSLSLGGVGAYVRYQFDMPVAVAVRYEYVDDEGLFGGIDQVLQEVTVTFEYRFSDAFLVRGECRRDWSNEPFFPGSLGANLLEYQNTALIGGVWTIGNKTGTW